MRVGVLTGGGDCPGLNAVIRRVVRQGVAEYGYEFVGFRDGWRGPLEGDTMPLDVAGGPRHPAARRHDPRLVADQPVGEIAASGGRTGVERIKDNLAGLGVDALIAIGGEDTLGVATRLYEQGVKVIGVPKTIDNDLGATDYTFGFDTAVNIAMEAIDRLHTTAESHHRALIVEVMGRHAGWIALHAGHRRRRQRHPDPGAAVRHRAGLRVRGAPVPDAGTRRSSWSPRAPRPSEADDRSCRPASSTRSATCGSAASAQRLADEIEKRTGKEARYDGARAHPARRHADRVRPGARHPVRPAGDRARCTTATSARWWRCAAPTSSGCRWPRRPGELKTVPPERYAEAEVFFG